MAEVKKLSTYGAGEMGEGKDNESSISLQQEESDVIGNTEAGGSGWERLVEM